MSGIRIAPLCLVLLLACAGPQAPEGARSEAAPRNGQPDLTLAELGASSYRTYCASCHGLEGRGDGPVAGVLQTPPANLRRIAQRNGGTFPDGEIARKIDGRFEIGAHGTREMPVWGRVFSQGIPDSGVAESVTRGQVAVLVEYLKSIQDPAHEGEEGEQTKKTMDEIFSAMRVLLPLSLAKGGFENRADEQRVRQALAVLDHSSAQLERHGASDDVGFAHLARSLSIDARDIRLRFDSGHRKEARYLVQTLTETCVACHSRLPSKSAPRSAAFVRDIRVKSLPIEQRAKLAYATRQFDVAQSLYETMLRSRDISATDLDLGGQLDDYLELMIRVRRDLPGAATALAGFAKRRDLSPALREEVESWIAALRRLAQGGGPASPLAAARLLVESQGEPIAGERYALVENLEASGLLHRALQKGLPRQQRAEAYYLLGLIETRIGRSYWLSEAEAYLETAIRLAPGEPIAGKAYDLLEEFLVAGYSGSGGTHVPPDIQAKLDVLKRIAESPPAS